MPNCNWLRYPCRAPFGRCCNPGNPARPGTPRFRTIVMYGNSIFASPNNHHDVRDVHKRIGTTSAILRLITFDLRFIIISPSRPSGAHLRAYHNSGLTHWDWNERHDHYPSNVCCHWEDNISSSCVDHSMLQIFAIVVVIWICPVFDFIISHTNCNS